MQWSSEKWNATKYQPGIPLLIKPDYEAVELQKLENMVEKSAEIGAFRTDKVEQWTKFLAEERKKAEMYETADLVD